MNYDDDYLGVNNSQHPANEIEVDYENVEFDELEILKDQVKIQTERLNYKIYQLKKLAEIEQSFKMFGNLAYEEQQEKNEILNQYLNN